MRRALLLGCVVALGAAGPAHALHPMPWVDRTPAGMGIVVCPAATGPDTLTWLSLREHSAATVTAGLAGRAQPFVRQGGCPSAASAPSGAAVVATTTGEPERVLAAVRPPGGSAFGAPVQLATRATQVNAAINDAGTTAIAWLQRRTTATVVVAAAVGGRPPADVSAPFRPIAGELATTEDLSPVVGVDAAGAAIVAWVQPRGGTTRGDLWVASGPGLATVRTLGPVEDIQQLAIATAPTGFTVLLAAGRRGVIAASGTTADGLGAPRVLTSDEASSPAAAVGADGAATAAWIQDSGGATMRARPAGGEFGPLQRLDSAPGDAQLLRLSAAPDGRVLAAWLRDGGRPFVLVPVAALGTVGGAFGPPQALAGSCRVVIAAIPVFTVSGTPRVILLDSEGLEQPGDLFLSRDVRVRVVEYSDALITPPRRVRLRLGGPRRQRLRDGRLVVSVRCDPRCDAVVSARGLIARRPRVPAGRAVRVALRLPFRAPVPSRRIRVSARACDQLGREVRASRTFTVARRR